MKASMSRVDVNDLDAANEPEPPVTGRSSEQHARRLSRLGWCIILFAIAPIGAWMALAPLSMAVVAPALIKVDLNRRPVQHLEGGIVREVLVRNGQVVKAGDAILALGDVRVDAERNRLNYRVQVERAALARLEAEQLRAQKLAFPDELQAAAAKDERVKQALLKEASLFEAGRDSLSSEMRLMSAQRDAVLQEIHALLAQIEQSQRSLTLQKTVYEANRRLVEGGFISQTRLAEFANAVAEHASKIEEQRSELARARQRRSDTDLKIKSIENTYVRSASDQLKQTVSRLADIEQEQRKSEDAASRQIVAAPASGEVIDLKFTSPGAVVRAGEPIADIVPSDAKLMVEARIRPEDINNVQRDQPARIKLSSFKYRKNPMVTGKVTYVSADRLVDRDVSYFSVMIAADEQSLHAAGDLKLQAGMPAEVYIEGNKQTALQYLAEPLTTTINKAGRQL
jgi:membrane fusion protein, epimerase transport system